MNFKLFKFLYIIFLLALSISLSYYFQDYFFSTSLPSKLDLLNYYGVVSTLTGLTITIIEISHNVSISKSIEVQNNTKLKNFRKIQTASVISDCISSIDSTTSNISIEEYKMALAEFRNFSKILLKYSIKNEQNLSEKLSEIEKKLLSSTHIKNSNGLNTKQKNILIKEILEIKEKISTVQIFED